MPGADTHAAIVNRAARVPTLRRSNPKRYGVDCRVLHACKLMQALQGRQRLTAMCRNCDALDTSASSVILFQGPN